ncbi:MAG: permease-like cell division protein FtsX [Nitrosomonas sp.]|nr:permease-like cell division protein FtsX [Nitrosomonas sp.]
MIKTWLGQHWFVFNLTLKRLVSEPVANLLSILVMGIAISLPAGIYTLVENLHTLSGYTQTAPQISLFMKQDSTRQDMDNIRVRLEENTRVAGYLYVPKDQALYQLQLDNGFDKAVQNLAHNPLPDAFIVDAENISTDVIEQLLTEMKTWPEIEHVQFDSAWAERLAALLDFGRIFVFILFTMLSIAIVAIMFNTIRLQILTRQKEIEVSKLIGASDSFIRRPFLYFGAIQGFAGGVTAWLIIVYVIQVLNDEIRTIAGLYALDLQLQPPDHGDIISLLFFAAWLGWLGARVSVASHLRHIELR